MADLALQSQHCWLACDIFCVKRRIAWNKLILKRDNNHFLLQLYILPSSPELGLLQAGPSYSTSAEPLADLRPGAGSQSVFLPSNKSLVFEILWQFILLELVRRTASPLTSTDASCWCEPTTVFFVSESIKGRLWGWRCENLLLSLAVYCYRNSFQGLVPAFRAKFLLHLWGRVETGIAPQNPSLCLSYDLDGYY